MVSDVPRTPIPAAPRTPIPAAARAAAARTPIPAAARATALGAALGVAALGAVALGTAIAGALALDHIQPTAASTGPRAPAQAYEIQSKIMESEHSPISLEI